MKYVRCMDCENVSRVRNNAKQCPVCAAPRERLEEVVPQEFIQYVPVSSLAEEEEQHKEPDQDIPWPRTLTLMERGMQEGRCIRCLDCGALFKPGYNTKYCPSCHSRGENFIDEDIPDYYKEGSYLYSIYSKINKQYSDGECIIKNKTRWWKLTYFEFWYKNGITNDDGSLLGILLTRWRN